MNFEELSDDEWMQIAALVSDEPPIRRHRRGRPRADPRVVANAVLWILTTGESWSRLPTRYPSGPTCRRRFDDWHANGTLVELVQLLSQRGRTFAYVPPAIASMPRDAAAPEELIEDDGQPSVFWKSPEAWQAPLRADGMTLHDARAADPMESITRQLANATNATTAAASPIARNVASARVDNALARPYPVEARRDDDPPVARNALPMWVSDAGQSMQMAEWRGYSMNLTVQPVRNRMYRASVEVLKDGRRIERSGLVGPAFNDRESAGQYAFDWGRKWIERECAPAGVNRIDGAADAIHTAVIGNTSSTAPQVTTRGAPGAAVALGQTLAQPLGQSLGQTLAPPLGPLHRLCPPNALGTLADDYDANASQPADTPARHGVAPRLRTTQFG